jgi:hypothetical protein
MLEELVPGNKRIISSATHEEIYLDVDLDKLAVVIKPEQVCELVRCGVIFNPDTLSLSMFV